MTTSQTSSPAAPRPGIKRRQDPRDHTSVLTSLGDMARQRVHAVLRTIPRAVRVRRASWVPLEQTGIVRRDYEKTFRYPGQWLNDFHRDVAEAETGRMNVSFCINVGIDGYLAQAEAAKLYELAYMTRGDVLELGTFRGLSASIMSRALADRGSGVLHSCDLDPAAAPAAADNMRTLPWAAPERVTFHTGDAADLMDRFAAEGRKFGFVFVDHWHGYDATHAAAIRVPALLTRGGFVQFHDFNDPAARDPDHSDKVWQAVNDTIAKDKSFRFCIVQASSAVFQML